MSILFNLRVLHLAADVPGTRYDPSSAGQPKGCPFRSIACVFNQRRLYANLQAAGGLAATTYRLEDAGQWRELAVHAQDIPGAAGMRFDLQVSTLTESFPVSKLCSLVAVSGNCMFSTYCGSKLLLAPVLNAAVRMGTLYMASGHKLVVCSALAQAGALAAYSPHSTSFHIAGVPRHSNKCSLKNTTLTHVKAKSYQLPSST